jgi:EAL domain-containing protein (putative c-di-GMP-specific phosphodiesterase class I)
MASAALALGAAKARGPNGYVRFAPHLREQAIRDVTVRAEVRSGLAEGQFVPFYQPKIDLRSGEIAGFEVLGRWNSRAGLRGPGDFIPALSDPELAREYFTRQLDQTLADVAGWRAAGLKVGRVALNTSSSDYVSFDLAEHVLRRLSETGLPADVLGLEITETVILSDMRGIERTISQLRNAGVEIALDDFGTGYASLTHLRGLPIDVVKIDKSFIDRIAHDPGDRAIISGIVSIGSALGLKVVAEGIENQEQVNTLRLAACDEGQGYLFGRPMPAHAIPEFLDFHNRSDWNPAAAGLGP